MKYLLAILVMKENTWSHANLNISYSFEFEIIKFVLNFLFLKDQLDCWDIKILYQKHKKEFLYYTILYLPSCIKEDKKYENEEKIDCMEPLPFQRGHDGSILGFCSTQITKNWLNSHDAVSEAILQLLFQPDVRNSRSIVFLVTKFTAASESKYTNYSLTQYLNCTQKVRISPSKSIK